MTRHSRITTLFTKKPEAGLVKTRLAPALGLESAAEFALAMLDDTVEKLTGTTAFETILYAAPPEALAWFRARYPRVPRCVAQVGASLGERLARGFADELAAGGRTLVAVGSDAPHTPIEWTIEAHERLEAGADLVIGLDDGGGYHSIGLKRSVPELFRAVPMSTADMGERTVELARTLGLVVDFLPESFDLDEPHDLARLRRCLEDEPGLSARLPLTQAFLARYCERS